MKSVSPLRLATLCLALCAVAHGQPKPKPSAPALAYKKCDFLPRMQGEAPRRSLAAGERIVVPVLNSRPNATAVIYLDFDGETVTDPGWDGGNTIVAQPLDLSAAEITEIFERCKEDWWPFKINITTDPTLYTKAAVGQRMRVIITDNDAAATGAGGVAYLNSFAKAGQGGLSTTVPAWVFNKSVIGISEAISHEVGHTMGLDHDGRLIPGQPKEEYFLGHGTGATSWCPIMGGSYYVKVSQWSKGEYQYANNQEDDIAKIASATNGFGFVNDEAGDTLATSAPLTVGSNDAVNQVGVITQSTDTDIYSFTTSGGNISLQCTGASPAPNLDVALELLNSNGGVIVSDKPDASLSASINQTLSAGKYYVRVYGTGAADVLTTGYSNYGSIGAYTITGNLPVVIVTPSATINDVTIQEGDTGTKNAVFTVNLSTASTQGVSVQYATADGTATAGADYTATAGTLTIPVGQIQGTISVPIIGDTAQEGDETFTVNLTNPSGLTLQDASGLGTIQDDDVPQISIQDVSITEGNSGSSKVQFKVSLSRTSPDVVTASYATKNVTATAGQDYTAATGTVTLQPGETSATIEVDVLGDLLDEADETFAVQLSKVTNASAPFDTAVCTILDDDESVSLTVNNPSVVEPDKDEVDLKFTLSLSGVSGQTVSLYAQTGAPNKYAATPDVDYVAFGPQLVTFKPGETTKEVTVKVKGDTIREYDERLRLVLTGASNVELTTDFGVGTIVDNDLDPRINIEPTSVVEGNSGTTKARFLVTLTGPTFQDVKVTCTTKKGTALGNSDFVPKSDTVTIPAGETSAIFAVLVNGDLLDETNETFTVSLFDPIGARMGNRGTAECVILDDDNKPAISVADVTGTEGDSGTDYFRFRVRLTAPSGRTVKVNYLASPLSATQGVDFKAVSGTLEIPAGQTLGIIQVPVFGDTEAENDEQFLLTLTAPIGANFNKAYAIGTIVDNDQKTELSISDASMTEGDEGYRTMKFTVSLSQPINRDVSFVVETGAAKEFPASPDGDFIPFAKTITIPAGETSVIVPVSVIGDTLDEYDERFRLLLSHAVNATIADNIGVGYIINDDTPPYLYVIGDEVVSEGDSGTVGCDFTIELTEPSGKPIQVTYLTGSGDPNPLYPYNAAPGLDYVSKTETVTIPAGRTRYKVSIAVKGDLLDEEDFERFAVGLRDPVNAALYPGFSYAFGYILDDDFEPEVSIAPVSQAEGNEFAHAFNFEVTLSEPSGRIITVDAATAAANVKPATAGEDYQVLSPTTVKFLPGETKKIVSVLVNGDTKVEGEERFRVTLTNPVNTSVATPFATGYILDDDGVPSVKQF